MTDMISPSASVSDSIDAKYDFLERGSMIHPTRLRVRALSSDRLLMTDVDEDDVFDDDVNDVVSHSFSGSMV